MNIKIAIAAVPVLAAAAGLFLGLGRQEPESGPHRLHGISRLHLGSRPVAITLVYSPDKRAFIEDAAKSFRAEHPEIRLTLSCKGPQEAAQAILQDRDRPTVWSPTDSLDLRLLRADLLASSGPDVPRSLVRSPLVFVIWEDRAAALLHEGGGRLNWRLIHDAVTVRQGWAAMAGMPEWGFVKLGHADPLSDSSGVQALLLMSFEYFGKASGLTIVDLLQSGYRSWIQGLAQGVPRSPPSASAVMDELVRLGPSQFDLALTYENVALWQLDAAQQRWASLRVYYPPITQLADHPAALLQGDWVSKAQKQAARTLLSFLHSRSVQKRAPSFGLRPADPSVSLRDGDDDPQAPFIRLAPYGIREELPGPAPAPDAAMVRALQDLWRSAAGTR